MTVAAVALALLLTPPAAHAQKKADEVPLIPRAVLLGNPDRHLPRLSPDGGQIAYLAEHGGVLNVWVASVDRPLEGRPITRETQRGVQKFQWAHTGRHILYFRDEPDGLSWRIFSVEIVAGRTVDLTRAPGLQPRLVGTNPSRPTDVYIAVNDRTPDSRDLHVVNLVDGSSELLQISPPGVIGWVVDRSRTPRFAVSFGRDGSQAILSREASGKWSQTITFASEDALTSGVLGMSADGRLLYLQDSRGRDTGALMIHDTETGEFHLAAHHPKADLDAVTANPATGIIDAASFRYLRREWLAVDPALNPDLAYLRTLGDGDIEIVSRTQDDTRWLVIHTRSNGPDAVVLYDRNPRRTRMLFVTSDALASKPLAAMHCVEIKARDGLILPCYLSLPSWRQPAAGVVPDAPLPLVVLVHGGPWARDTWGFHGMHQLLTNRGYAVLSVNFRGSTGFGKAFVNAGNLQWGRAMQDDLVDAARWAMDRGIADPERIAVMGASYGGYASLMALATSPDVFRFGVSICGPVNLVSLMESLPIQWKPLREVFSTRAGDWTRLEGRSDLLARSPVSMAERIRGPVLAIHGATDPRATLAEAEGFYRDLQGQERLVTFATFADEAHGIESSRNVLAMCALIEAFLARHLGGRAEEIGDSLEQSSGTIRFDRNNLSAVRVPY